MTAAIRLADRVGVLRRRALLALRDCGCIRADWDAPGFLMLWREGLASASDVPGTSALADFRLTARGREAARQHWPEVVQ